MVTVTLHLMRLLSMLRPWTLILVVFGVVSLCHNRCSVLDIVGYANTLIKMGIAVSTMNYTAAPISTVEVYHHSILKLHTSLCSTVCTVILLPSAASLALTVTIRYASGIYCGPHPIPEKFRAMNKMTIISSEASSSPERFFDD
jgi:hypothetical protein